MSEEKQVGDGVDLDEWRGDADRQLDRSGSTAGVRRPMSGYDG